MNSLQIQRPCAPIGSHGIVPICNIFHQIKNKKSYLSLLINSRVFYLFVISKIRALPHYQQLLLLPLSLGAKSGDSGAGGQQGEEVKEESLRIVWVFD
ncbi:hypothetical protein XELAEV_18033868mg [Xenopus laevis]|uniref:Uncharacterized protein n=1 Tax=Xenopus laevis TaxID=8355 RepID=A0A974HET4_XENLA|nr:hypothetical protein XELAEV_18033868mg [Xenopus laevis]